jgi:hypothetical protein
VSEVIINIWTWDAPNPIGNGLKKAKWMVLSGLVLFPQQSNRHNSPGAKDEK